MKPILFLLLSSILISCSDSYNESGTDGWLKGTIEERIDTVAEHLGGFSPAMKDIGYRYNELYWAGVDGNWDYAEYQAEHIEEYLEYGLQRRPQYRKSAETFLNVDLPAMEKAISLKDSTTFFAQFSILTMSCNSCHVMEKVGFINIREPEVRSTPVRK